MVNALFIEELFQKLGKPGRYHIIFYSIILTFNFFILSNYVTMVTMVSMAPDFRCAPKPDYLERFQSENKNESISQEDLYYEKCFVNLVKNSSSLIKTKRLPCTDWIFDKIDDKKVVSLVTQWKLVCEKRFYSMLSATLFFVGILCGATLLSHLPDRYGRRRVMLISLSVAAIINTFSVLANNIIVYTAIRFVFGIVVSTSHSGLNILCMEMTQKTLNVIITLLMTFSVLLTLFIGAGVGWLIMNWWQIQLVLTIPLVIALIIAYFILPESFKWLIVHNKKEELRFYVERAAWINGINVKEARLIETVDKLIEPMSNKEPDAETEKKIKYSLVQIFKHAELRRRVLLGCTIACTMTTAFYVAVINVSSSGISSHPYKLMLISSGLDTIPMVFIFPILNRFGKRRLSVLYCSIASLFLIIYKIYNHIAFLMVGKMFLMVVVGVVFFVNIDIYPTVVRHTCNGLTMVFGRLGGILGPQIVLLGSYTSPDIPVLFAGILTLIALVCLYCLPDMTRSNNPNTLQDLDEFVKQKVTKRLLKNEKELAPLAQPSDYA